MRVILLSIVIVFRLSTSYASDYHPDEEAVVALLPKTVLIKDIEQNKCPEKMTSCTVSKITEKDIGTMIFNGDAAAIQLSKVGDSKRAYLCLEFNSVVWLQTFVPGIIEDDNSIVVGRLYANRPTWVPDTLPGVLTQYKNCSEAMIDAKAGNLL